MAHSLISTRSDDLRFSTERGLPLVVVIPGVADAGNSVQGLYEFLWEHCDPQVIFDFNADELIDYRARRPIATIKNQRVVEVSEYSLTLALAHDELGAPFILLSGFEPDFRWEAVVDEVLKLVDEFEIDHTTIFHAVPMPVPHTRETQFTVTGTREDLLAEHGNWMPNSTFPGPLTTLLEYRLQNIGEDVMSWVALVPHYLASNDYPVSVLAMLSALSTSTGRIFDTVELSGEAEQFLNMVDQQVSESEENLALIADMEQRFDQYQQNQEARVDLLGASGEIPSADELAFEFERFLAKKNKKDRPEDPIAD